MRRKKTLHELQLIERNKADDKFRELQEEHAREQWKASLPDWIVVTAKDPKLKEAIEKKLAETFSKGQKP